MRKTNLKRGIAARIVLVLFALVFLGAALTGCSAGPVHQISVGTVSTTEGENNLSSDDIKALAEEIVDNQNRTVKVGDIDVKFQAAIVAALRGYDMTAEGFDDENLPEAQPEKAGEFALNVIEKINESITKEKDKIDVVRFSDMNEKDVQSVVNCLKTEVDLSAPDFLGTILHWIGIAFSWMINVLGFGSFVLGSLFFAILVEIIMLPISYIQQKNQRKQAMLRPKEMAIRKKYAGRNDQVTMQKLQMEIQEMYQKEGYNPMTAGCLPLLISMPVVLALYYIVIDPVQYILGAPAAVSNALITFATAPNAAGGLGITLSSDKGTIEILSLLADKIDSIGLIGNFEFFANAPDIAETLTSAVANGIPNFSLWGVNFGLNPRFGEPWALLSIPVLTFVIYYFSMKLNRKLSYQPTNNPDDKAAGCSNKMMELMMPIMSVWISFVVPAAVGIYWIFKSMVGTAKQFVMSRVMPMPQFTEEDYKAAERELLGKEKKKPKKPSGTRNPNVRSLHHIDDEDFINEKPASSGKGNKKPAAIPEYTEEPEQDTPAQEETEESRAQTLINGAPLKDESDRERKKSRGKKDED